ncbi:MAG: MotA/TolQ/ExbB proton channel family protein [Pseudomonadota bacterium]
MADTQMPSLGAPDTETSQSDVTLPSSDATAPQALSTPDAMSADSVDTTGPALDVTDAERPSAELGVSELTTTSDTQGNADSAPSVDGLDTGEITSDELGLGGSQVGSDAIEVPRSDENDAVSEALDASERAMEFLRNGGPALWAIAALSVVTLALILWKIWRLALLGAWSRGQAAQAAAVFELSGPGPALKLVDQRRGIRSQVMATTLRALSTMNVDVAREETARVAKRRLSEARVGLGALELISTVAPLLGLLGTVLGMIAAFQALQAAGARADPTLLAGGIWEALLTTAAGMAVAIPASAALTWFEAVVERMRQDIEDNATRLFVSTQSDTLALAAQ